MRLEGVDHVLGINIRQRMDSEINIFKKFSVNPAQSEHDHLRIKTFHSDLRAQIGPRRIGNAAALEDIVQAKDGYIGGLEDQIHQMTLPIFISSLIGCDGEAGRAPPSPVASLALAHHFQLRSTIPHTSCHL